MRISALSEVSGVSVATIKYYLREGLLPRGTPTARNQADYTDAHVRRLRLIRTLREVAKMSTTDVAAVVAAIDDENVGLHKVIGVAQDSLADVPPIRHPDGRQAARAWVDDFVARHGFNLGDEGLVRDDLAAVVERLAEFGVPIDDPSNPFVVEFDRVADFWQVQAAADVATIPDGNRDDAVEYATAGTVLMDAAISAIRRIALEDASARRFGIDQDYIDANYIDDDNTDEADTDAD